MEETKGIILRKGPPVAPPLGVCRPSTPPPTIIFWIRQRSGLKKPWLYCSKKPLLVTWGV